MSRVADRDDRMMAYYIKLIEEQEKQDKKRTSDVHEADSGSVDDAKRSSKKSNEKPKSSDNKPNEEKEEADKGDSARDELSKEEKPKEGSKRGTKEKRDSMTEETPRKVNGTRALEQAEAERIISTILERRPGRAEFSVPKEETPRKKPRRSDERSSPAPKEASPPKPASAIGNKPVKEEEPVAEQVVTKTSSDRKRRTDPVEQEPRPRRKTLAEIEAERIIATIIERRPTSPTVPAGRGAPMVAPAELPPVAEPVPPVAEEPAKPKTAPKAPTKPKPEKPKPSVPAEPKPKTEERPKRTSEQRRPVEEAEEVKSAFTLAAEKQWWHKPVSLEVIPFEDELDAALDRIDKTWPVLANESVNPSLAERMCDLRPSA